MSYDINLQKTGTQEGDFVITECEQQNIEAILQSNFNSFKEFPTFGAGLLKYLNGSFDVNDLVRNIKVQLQSDNLSSVELVVNKTNGLEVTILNAIRL